jgi:MAX-like protein X
MGNHFIPRQGVTWKTRAVTSVSCQVEGGWPPPERWCEQLFSSVVPVLLGGSEEEPGGRQLLDLDCFLSDISDTLFTMTQPSPSSLQLPPEDGEE